MKKFSIWLRENKQWNEEGMFRRRPTTMTHTVAPNHTVHIHTTPKPKTQQWSIPPASTPNNNPSQTVDWKPSPSKDPNATVDFDPQAANDYQYHDHPVVNRMLNMMKHDIDALTWDYGKDTIETAFDLATEVHPLVKPHADNLKAHWKRFKDALYKELKEGQTPWWGAPRSGPPNPVLYQSLLMRFKELDKLFDQLKKLCSECEKDELNQLFLTFMKEYSRVVPGIKAQVETFLKNTPQRR